MNFKKVCEIIGQKFDEEPILDEKRVAWFSELDLKQCQDLADGNVLDLTSSQNTSPEAIDLMKLMQDFDGVFANGYMRCSDKPYVILTGIDYDGPANRQLEFAFLDLCRHADEFEFDEGHLYAKWD